MRVGEPEYVIKIMARVGENDLPEAASILRETVAPVMRGSGFSELIIVARSREFKTVDPNAPAIAGSRILSRLVAEAPPHESVLGYVRRRLPRMLGKDVPQSLGGGYRLNNMRKKNPAAFERLHQERVAEQEKLEELLLAGENWSRVTAFQLDCYAVYASEAELKADTLDLQNNEMSVPHSARLLAKELDHLLLMRLTGAHHTVVHRTLATPPAERSPGPMFAMQAQIALDGGRVTEAAEEISSLLMPGPEVSPGFAGALVLGSRREGFSAGSRWCPRTLPEHRGEPSGSDTANRRTEPRDAPVPYEVLTLWETEADLLGGAERISEPMEGSTGPFPERGEFHTEHGTLALHE